MTGSYRGGLSLWDEEGGFFYDALHLPDGRIIPLKVRSLVGLLPLLAVETLEPELLDAMPDFSPRRDWFFETAAISGIRDIWPVFANRANVPGGGWRASTGTVCSGFWRPYCKSGGGPGG